MNMPRVLADRRIQRQADPAVLSRHLGGPYRLTLCAAGVLFVVIAALAMMQARLPAVIVGSQHVSMAFGQWQDTLEKTGELLGMEVRHL